MANTDVTCDFCDGTGRWTDSTCGNADPCFVCNGTGVLAPDEDDEHDASDASPAGDADDLLVTVSALTQGERQRLYEELHRRWNCRIYEP